MIFLALKMMKFSNFLRLRQKYIEISNIESILINIKQLENNLNNPKFNSLNLPKFKQQISRLNHLNFGRAILHSI